MEERISRAVEERLSTPILGEYDVIVAGAGPAGAAAAIAAGRAGCKTLLIEKTNAPGGMWTAGLINPLFDGEGKPGLMREILDELKNEGTYGGFWNISFDFERMKTLLEEKLAAANVEVLYDTLLVRAMTEGERVTGVIVENISGRGAYLGKMFIDGTGNGDLAARSDCAFLMGGEAGRLDLQAMTLMFLVTGFPEKYRKGLFLQEKVLEVYRKSGKKPPFTMPYLITVPSGKFAVIQHTHMYDHDPLSAKSLSEANREGRRQMVELVELLRRYDEEFKDLQIILSAPQMGVRESRRIVGEYTLTYEDLLAGTCFSDGVATVNFHVDIHPKDGNGQDCRPTKPYEIPFRSMLPKGKENLIVAGRCISGDHIAMASYRVTGDCVAMGEAAGILAAESLHSAVPLRKLDVKAVLAKRRKA